MGNVKFKNGNVCIPHDSMVTNGAFHMPAVVLDATFKGLNNWRPNERYKTHDIAGQSANASLCAHRLFVPFNLFTKSLNSFYGVL